MGSLPPLLHEQQAILRTSSSSKTTTKKQNKKKIESKKVPVMLPVNGKNSRFLLRAGNRLFLSAVQVNVTGCFTEIFTEIIQRMFVSSKVKSH